MESTTTLKATRPDELSIKNMILAMQAYGWYLLKNWYWIVLIAVGVGAVFYWKTPESPPLYEAKISFFVKTPNLNKENKEIVKIYSNLTRTRNILEKACLQEVFIGEEKDLLINHYLKVYLPQRPILQTALPSDFSFSTHDKTKFTAKEQHAFNLIIGLLQQPSQKAMDGFLRINIDEQMGTVTLFTLTQSATLSMNIVNGVYTAAKMLFLDAAGFGWEKAYVQLKIQADSLQNGFEKSLYSYQYMQDKYQRDVKKYVNARESNLRSAESKLNKLSVKAEMYKLNYLETLEQLKVAEVRRHTSTPMIEIIDQTHPPIAAFVPNRKMVLAKGAIIGAVMAIFLLIAGRFYKEIMTEEII